MAEPTEYISTIVMRAVESKNGDWVTKREIDAAIGIVRQAHNEALNDAVARGLVQFSASGRQKNYRPYSHNQNDPSNLNKIRRCLRCQREFVSTHVGNRVCSRCREANERDLNSMG